MRLEFLEFWPALDTNDQRAVTAFMTMAEAAIAGTPIPCVECDEPLTPMGGVLPYLLMMQDDASLVVCQDCAERITAKRRPN